MVETFAGHFQAQLTLLYVLEPFAYNDIPMDATGASEKRLAEYLTDETEQLDVRRVLLEGDPASQIVEYARSEGFDLIMMPTHGYEPFRRMILGSVTSSVLRDAVCPVWTGVHMEQVPKLEDIAFRKIVCAIDLGRQSCPTLRWAACLASEFGAELEIVHAIGDASDPIVLGDDVVRQATLKIQAFQAAAGCAGRISVIGQEVASGVCRLACQEKADLLVIGRSMHDGILGRLRANAYSIIRQAPCPVLSI